MRLFTNCWPVLIHVYIIWKYIQNSGKLKAYNFMFLYSERVSEAVEVYYCDFKIYLHKNKCHAFCGILLGHLLLICLFFCSFFFLFYLIFSYGDNYSISLRFFFRFPNLFNFQYFIQSLTKLFFINTQTTGILIKTEYHMHIFWINQLKASKPKLVNSDYI